MMKTYKQYIHINEILEDIFTFVQKTLIAMIFIIVIKAINYYRDI